MTVRHTVGLTLSNITMRSNGARTYGSVFIGQGSATIALSSLLSATPMRDPAWFLGVRRPSPAALASLTGRAMQYRLLALHQTHTIFARPNGMLGH